MDQPCEIECDTKDTSYLNQKWYPDIKVNKNAEFFIAIGKSTQGNSKKHSFVMLGVMQNKRPILLAKVGKIPSRNKGACDVELGSESIRNFSAPICYAAYAITYAHYQQFIKFLSFAANGKEYRRTAHIQAYQQVGDADENTIMMTYEHVSPFALSEATEQEKAIIKRSQWLFFCNTCRNTAMDVLAYVQKVKKLRGIISRFFFIDLPLFIRFNNGYADENMHFYVFPPPPTTYPQSEKRKQYILNTIYQRMEDLIKKDPGGQNTIDKFELLKKLYLEQAGIPDRKLSQVLQSINRWRDTHRETLGKIREQSSIGKLFGSSASTLKMADKLEADLSSGYAGW